MFRGLLARRLRRKQNEVVVVIQRFVKEKLEVWRKAAKDRLNYGGVQVNQVYKRGHYVCGRYVVVSVLKAGAQYMFHGTRAASVKFHQHSAAQSTHEHAHDSA